MFLGQFQHNLDDKGRLMIPARFRELLEGGAYITQGFDKCLMVLTEEYFKQVYERIEAMNAIDWTIVNPARGEWTKQWTRRVEQ